jgi:hypothetical protein
MAITIVQERVMLVSPCREGKVVFHWPDRSELVRVTSRIKCEEYSVEEAHELFDAFLAAGWY